MTIIDAETTDLVVVPNPFELTAMGMVVNGDPSLQEWLDFGKTLRGIRSATLWTVGDWVNYGESRTDYGEKYTQALNEMEYDYGALRNLSWIAHAFPLSRRHDKLTHSHHAAVASKKLPANVQDELLNEAAATGMNRDDLREKVKKILKKPFWETVINEEMTFKEFQGLCEAKGIDPDHKYRFTVRKYVEPQTE